MISRAAHVHRRWARRGRMGCGDKLVRTAAHCITATYPFCNPLVISVPVNSSVSADPTIPMLVIDRSNRGPAVLCTLSEVDRVERISIDLSLKVGYRQR